MLMKIETDTDVTAWQRQQQQQHLEVKQKRKYNPKMYKVKVATPAMRVEVCVRVCFAA